MKLTDIFPSKYLSATDLQGKEAVAVIESVELTKFEDGSQKPLIRFKDVQKGLIANKTNCSSIAELYGDDTDGWIGQQICLFSMTVQFQNKVVEGIRIKRPPQAEVAPAPIAVDPNSAISGL